MTGFRLAMGVDWEEETRMLGGLGELVSDSELDTFDSEYQSYCNLRSMTKQRLRWKIFTMNVFRSLKIMSF